MVRPGIFYLTGQQSFGHCLAEKSSNQWESTTKLFMHNQVLQDVIAQHADYLEIKYKLAFSQASATLGMLAM